MKGKGGKKWQGKVMKGWRRVERREGIRLDRTMVRSLPVRLLQPKVRSLHSKVRSLHQISYFATNKVLRFML